MIDDLPLEHGDFPYVKLSSRIQKVSYAQHKWSPWTPFDVWSPGPVGTSVVGVLQTTPILWPRISMDFYGFLWISGRLEAHDSSWLIMAIRMIHLMIFQEKDGWIVHLLMGKSRNMLEVLSCFQKSLVFFARFISFPNTSCSVLKKHSGFMSSEMSVETRKLLPTQFCHNLQDLPTVFFVATTGPVWCHRHVPGRGQRSGRVWFQSPAFERANPRHLSNQQTHSRPCPDELFDLKYW